MGVLGYQRAFIKNYAHLARPLHNLLKKGEKFEWTDECKRSLDTLIGQIATDPVLTAPDESHPFELEMDASSYAVGAALFQKDARGKRKAIRYASKTLNSAERNYHIWDREFLGLIFGLTVPIGDICYVEPGFWTRYLLTTPTSCTTTTPRRSIEEWRVTSSPWPTTTSKSITSWDPLTEQMHCLKGQTTMKERRTTIRLSLCPYPCLRSSSEPLHWMP